jgi:hypothetical protein
LAALLNQRLNLTAVHSFLIPYVALQSDQNQYTNQVNYYQRLFDRGTLYEVLLFLDFEDWRIGARSFNMEGISAPSNDTKHYVRGGHFNIFDIPSAGFTVPTYLTDEIQGLVLDRTILQQQLTLQEALVADLRGEIDWMEENIETATMSPALRARKDVRAGMTHEIMTMTTWWKNELAELRLLNSSQCTQTACKLQFNTSSLQMTGAITGSGNSNSPFPFICRQTHICYFNYHECAKLPPPLSFALLLSSV